MRVLFTSSGWPTHYLSMVPLAWALRAAGHEVRVACQPSMVATVTRSGMPAVEVGTDVDYMAIRKRTLAFELQGAEHDKDPAKWPAEGASGVDEFIADWRRTTFGGLDDIVALARAWRPDLIIGDTMAPSGLVAAHAIGVPGVRHLFGPDILGSVEGEKVLQMLPGALEEYERFGARPQGDPACWTIDPCPPSMQPPPAKTRLGMRWVPYNGPGTAPRWLLEPPAARVRICLTWGTSTTQVVGEDRAVIPAILAALAEFDAEVIVAVTAAERGLIGEGGPRLRVVEGLPLHLVVPHCALLVHQGGATTMLTAAYHGVRQLAVTQLPAQAQDSDILARTGAAIHLPDTEATEEALRRAIDDLLVQPSYGEAAERLREEIHAQPTPAEMVAVLEETARSGG